MDKEKLREVANFFIDEREEEGLKSLYELTNESLVKILIDWKKNYKEINDTRTNQYVMYLDILHYIFEKYNLFKYLGEMKEYEQYFKL